MFYKIINMLRNKYSIKGRSFVKQLFFCLQVIIYDKSVWSVWNDDGVILVLKTNVNLTEITQKVIVNNMYRRTLINECIMETSLC